MINLTVIFWGLLAGILVWLITNHPVKENQKKKDNYGYFFERKNKEDK